MTSRLFNQPVQKYCMLTSSITGITSFRHLRTYLSSISTIRTITVSPKPKLEHSQFRAQSKVSKSFPEAMDAIKQTVAQNLGIGVCICSSILWALKPWSRPLSYLLHVSCYRIICLGEDMLTPNSLRGLMNRLQKASDSTLTIRPISRGKLPSSLVGRRVLVTEPVTHSSPTASRSSSSFQYRKRWSMARSKLSRKRWARRQLRRSHGWSATFQTVCVFRSLCGRLLELQDTFWDPGVLQTLPNCLSARTFALKK